MDAELPRHTTDTVVVGASAAGLAVSALLSRAGHQVELLEASDAVGTVWSGRYDRLHLHSPRSMSALPGLPMPRRWPRYPSKDQVAAYLESYRERFGLQPRFGERVSDVRRLDGAWVVHSTDGEWHARNVVIATGMARQPVRASWPSLDEFRGDVLHTADFCNGERWRGSRVLVVGFGNSAGEQAIDLVEHGAEVHLSVRSPVNVVRRDLLGVIPVVRVGVLLSRLPARWANALAAPIQRLTVGDLRPLGLRRPPVGPITQIARDRRIPLIDIGTLALIKAGRIVVHPGIEQFTSDGVRFGDGSSLSVDGVLLGTGFRPALEDFLPDWRLVCDEQGNPTVSGGPTALPGLYFCGFEVVAGLLGHLGTEARRIAAHLTDTVGAAP